MFNKKKFFKKENLVDYSKHNGINEFESNSEDISPTENIQNFSGLSEFSYNVPEYVYEGQKQAVLKINNRKFILKFNEYYYLGEKSLRNSEKKKFRDKDNFDGEKNYAEHRIIKDNGKNHFKRPTDDPPCICVRGTRYSIISRVARSMGWTIVNDIDLWNIYWTDSLQGIDLYKDMKRFQKTNHFPGMVEICRKDLLARNLTRMMRLFPVDYNIFPKTWCFPADLREAITYSRQHKNNTFILKPDQGAQGRGIWLTKNLKDVKLTEDLICQVYLNSPLLIDGYKFDLRVYTLITSVDPLRIFVFNEGLARFATSKYKEPTCVNTSDLFMHLTNYSVNKHSKAFCKDVEAGSKRKFSTLNRILISEGFNIKRMWANIDDVIIKTILSAWPVLKHNYRACFPSHDIMEGCFEILGFDILIDSRMKPYVLEVNHSPSFHTAEPIDREVKEPLIRDTLNLLNVSNFNKKKILTEDRNRVKTRLLRNIYRDTSKDNDGTDEIEEDYCEAAKLSESMSQQILWEENHMGGFRLILPNPVDPNKYTKYLMLQSQSSMYAETAASKKREESAKQLRIQLIERASENKKVLLANKTKNGSKLNAELENRSVRKRKMKKILYNNGWLPYIISDILENERIVDFTARTELIKDSGIIKRIYESFYRNEILTEADKAKYKNLFGNPDTEIIHREVDHVGSNSSLAPDDLKLPLKNSINRIGGKSDINKHFRNGKCLRKSLSSTELMFPSLEIQNVDDKYTAFYYRSRSRDRYIS